MTPLRVTARLGGRFATSRGGIALDALLASQVALREQLPPPRSLSDCQPIEIPIEREPGGRFHLCSFSVAEFDARELKYLHRRAPVAEYQTIGSPKIRRALISAGVNKSYRIPIETRHAADDTLTWWCLGEAGAIIELLTTVFYLGRRRAVGLGKVLQWQVEPCEIWDGFPVVRDGKPLRALPPDWPGLDEPRLQRRTISYPYWAHELEEVCACP